MTRITGYAAVFGRADSQADRIAPGAFLASLARHAGRVPLLWQHDMAEPIGRLTTMREDDIGLWFDADLSGSRRARDAAALLQAGALRECSIGFLPRRIAFERRGQERVRVLQQIDLIEISLVTLAANPLARVISVDGASLGPGPPIGTSASIWRRRLAAVAPTRD